MFNLIFWGIILILVFADLKQRFVYSLSSAIALLFAFYFSFWELEPITALVTQLPVNLGDMAKPLVLILLFSITSIFFKKLLRIPESFLENNFPDENEILTSKIRYCGNAVANFLSGTALATFLCTVIAITPAAKNFPVLSEPGITAKATGGIRFISGLVDTLTWQKDYRQTRERLMRKSFGQPTLEETQLLKDIL